MVAVAASLAHLKKALSSEEEEVEELSLIRLRLLKIKEHFFKIFPFLSLKHLEKLSFKPIAIIKKVELNNSLTEFSV